MKPLLNEGVSLKRSLQRYSVLASQGFGDSSYIHTYTYIYIYTYTFTYTSTSTSTHVRVFVRVCVCVCLCVRRGICVCVCMVSMQAMSIWEVSCQVGFTCTGSRIPMTCAQHGFAWVVFGKPKESSRPRSVSATGSCCGASRSAPSRGPVPATRLNWSGEVSRPQPLECDEIDEAGRSLGEKTCCLQPGQDSLIQSRLRVLPAAQRVTMGVFVKFGARKTEHCRGIPLWIVPDKTGQPLHTRGFHQVPRNEPVNLGLHFLFRRLVCGWLAAVVDSSPPTQAV